MAHYTNRSSTWITVSRHNSCMPKEKKTDEALLAGQRIRSVCRGLGIDRKELAQRTKIGYSTLGNYEQGLRELPIREAKRIEKATGVPAAYLMGLIDEDDMQLLRAPRAAREAALQMIKSVASAKAPLGIVATPAPDGPFLPAHPHHVKRRA